MQDGLTTAQSIYFPSKIQPEYPEAYLDGSLITGASDEIFLSDGIDYRIKLQRWKTLFPESKVLIIIRNQPDIIFSGYRTWLRDGYFRSVDSYFRELIWDAQTSPLGYLFFDRAYEITREYFDEVLMLPYEKITHFDSFIAEINNFFNVSVKLEDNPVNTSSNDSVVAVLRTLNFLFRHGRGRSQMTILPDYINGKTRFTSNNVPGQEPSPRFRKAVNKFAVRVGARLPVHGGSRGEFLKKHREIFEDIFGESNRRIESLLKIDLGQYGYIGTGRNESNAMNLSKM